jgi:ribosome biogenesis GTPase
VVLVNKSDLYSAAENREAAETLRRLCPAADIHITSAEKGKSLKVLKQYLKRGVTVALVGSSGVGKSSIVNQLLGDEYQWTDEVNEVTGKGRHTTTARELMILPGGGILIDNPGIREVHMWTDETTLRERFADIALIASACRFHDCRHGSDVGCAIREALTGGKLEPGRYEAFLKLDDEIAELRRNRQKRRMTVERIARREQRERAKRFADRRQIDPDPEVWR